jgi:histone deacetylase 11
MFKKGIKMHKNKVNIFAFFCLLVTTHIVAHKKYPIVYSPGYNISLGKWLDKIIGPLHPFDTKKYAKIHNHLKQTFNLTDDQFYTPTMITDEELLKIHDKEYLESLKKSQTISQAVDLWNVLAIFPNSMIQTTLLNPMRLATGGTVLAAQLAMEYGWAINLSGGYHHAQPNHGEGGCIFADVPLAIKTMRQNEKYKNIKILIVDLDAHQGNGNALCLKNDPNTFIFDMYNTNEYPVYSTQANVNAIYNGKMAAQHIRFNNSLDGGYLGTTTCSQYLNISVPILSIIPFIGATDEPIERRVNGVEYLNILVTCLTQALYELNQENNFPDLIIFNAGSDIFERDDLGILNVSKSDIIRRDQFVWQTARENDIAIMMVLSGGYGPENAGIVSESIANILSYEQI